jgi:hypothetical protein
VPKSITNNRCSILYEDNLSRGTCHSADQIINNATRGLLIVRKHVYLRPVKFTAYVLPALQRFERVLKTNATVSDMTTEVDENEKHVVFARWD